MRRSMTKGAIAARQHRARRKAQATLMREAETRRQSLMHFYSAEREAAAGSKQ